MKDIPDQALPVEAEERWKAKKWAGHIFARFFGRFGNAKFTDNDHNEFATFVGKNIAPLLLRSCLSQLQLPKHGRYCTAATARPLLLPTRHALVPERSIELRNTWAEMKPHLNFILFECVFMLLCMTEDDRVCAQAIRHHGGFHLSVDGRSPVSLVRAFAQCKPKTTLQKMLDFMTNMLNPTLQKTLDFMTNILNTY